MYFHCRICDKLADDGILGESICLECVDTYAEELAKDYPIEFIAELRQQRNYKKGSSEKC